MTTSNSSPKTLNKILWAVQFILAVIFGLAGTVKATMPFADLNVQMSWTSHFPELMIRMIGISEMAASLGLILPSLLRIKPRLTVWAASCMVVVMIMALVLHVSLKEFSSVPVNVVLASLSGLVAWGRGRKVVIEAKAQ